MSGTYIRLRLHPLYRIEDDIHRPRQQPLLSFVILAANRVRLTAVRHAICKDQTVLPLKQLFDERKCGLSEEGSLSR